MVAETNRRQPSKRGTMMQVTAFHQNKEAKNMSAILSKAVQIQRNGGPEVMDLVVRDAGSPVREKSCCATTQWG